MNEDTYGKTGLEQRLRRRMDGLKWGSGRHLSHTTARTFAWNYLVPHCIIALRHTQSHTASLILELFLFLLLITLRIYCNGITWSGGIQLHLLKQRILVHCQLPLRHLSYMVTVLTTLIPTTFYHCISDKDNLVAIFTPNCRLVTWRTLKLQSPTPGLPAHSYFPLESYIFTFCQIKRYIK